MARIQTRIRWKDEQINLIVPKAAELMLKSDRMRIWEAVIQAQNLVLSPEKRRPETVLKVVAKSVYGDAIQAKMKEMLRQQTDSLRPEVKEAAAQEAQAQTQQVESTQTVEGPEVELIQKLPSSIESTIETAARFIAEDFYNMLVPMLRQSAGQAFQKVGSEVMLHKDVDSIGDVKTQTVTDALRERGVQVMNVGSESEKHIDITRLKVVLLDSAERGNNLRFITEGLEEVYKFYPAARLEEVARLKNMDLIVATQFSTAPMRETAKRLNPNATFIMAHNPKSANEELTNYFCNRLEVKQSKEGTLNRASAH